MRPIGLGDELRVALRIGATSWGVLCLHHEDATAGFDPREIKTVVTLAPHFAEGLRRALILEGFAASAPGDDHGVIILDTDGAVRSASDAAERWLSEIAAAEWPQTAPMPLPVMALAARLGQPIRRTPRRRDCAPRGVDG